MTDRELVQTVERTRPQIWRSLKHRFRDVDPEDFQTSLSEAVEAFVHVIRRGKLKVGDTPFGFMRMVTKNSLLKRMRRSKLERPISTITVEPDGNDLSARGFNLKMTNDSILRRMRRDYRDFMILFYRKSFSLEEIRLMTGKTMGGIYHLKERAEKQAHEIATSDGLCPPRRRNNRTKTNSKKR